MNRTFFFLLAWGTVLGLGLTLSGSSCGPKQVTLEYDVTGSGGVTNSASVTYSRTIPPVQSNVATLGVTLPWTISFPATITEGTYMGSYVYLYAQNNTSDPNSILTVTIKENGAIFSQAAVTGASPAAVSINGTF
jgi:hypothetical protein